MIESPSGNMATLAALLRCHCKLRRQRRRRFRRGRAGAGDHRPSGRRGPGAGRCRAAEASLTWAFAKRYSSYCALLAARELALSALPGGHGVRRRENRRRRPLGFTLVELLVVITIIGILVAMLLPAVQAAREGGRRAACLNNLKQLGLAVKQYESQWDSYPPATCVHNTSSPNYSPTAGTTAVDANQPASEYDNWVIEILPYIEMAALYDKFESHPNPLLHPPGTTMVVNPVSAGTSNAAARAVSLPFMLCPTDSYNRRAFNGSKGPETKGFGDNWARGNYGANMGLGCFCDSWDTGWYTDGPMSISWITPAIRGVCGVNCGLRTADIGDGTGNTILLGELRPA